MSAIQVAIGRVKKADRDDRGVRLEVDLVHHQRKGEALQAICRLVSPFHGEGYGDWSIPDVGIDLLCFFPGVSPDGTIGDDLDAGYALGALATDKELPPEGLQGDFATDRRVSKGRPGTALDTHIQGDRNAQVDGDETLDVDGDQMRTVEGNQDTMVGGDQDLQVSGDVSEIIGSLTQQIVGILKVAAAEGDYDFTGPVALDIIGNVVANVLGTTTLTLGQIVTITAGLTLNISALTIGIGPGTQNFLLNSLARAVFNSHSHSGGGSGPPTTEMGLDTQTANLRAS